MHALAKGAASGDHPDPDLLTAFAEGSLLEREREAVMAHLAVCAACRQALSLSAAELEPAQDFQLVAAAAAAPMAEPVAGSPRRDEAPVRPKRHTWMAWGAVAAGIAIVSVVALRHAYLKPAQIALAPELKSAPVDATAAAPAPAPRMQPSLKAGKKALGAFVKAAPEAAPQIAASAKGENAVGEPSGGRRASTADRSAMQSLEVNANALRAQNVPREQQQVQAAQQESAQMALDAQVSPPAPVGAATPIGESRAVTPALAGSFAKSANMTPVARPHWRINDAGHLERAFGGGPWQPVLTNESTHMRVVSVVGAEVWAGGENKALYRSHDEGATWERVALPSKNGAGHTITQIRFANLSSGVVVAEDGTAWTTTDGGSTWN
ncbi:MAG TPA: YCF48-related protein [Gammaproteobacteria bacterium]|nr:YCF48-related protein [Gammaproteobacteria bacterium]